MARLDDRISMYPIGVRKIQRYVSEACDRMEYKNSPIFDEYPEKTVIDRMSCSICETILSEEGPGILEFRKEEEKNPGRMEAERLRKDQLTACQASPRGGTLYCRLAGDRVVLAGHAALFSQGEILMDQ